MKACIKIIEEKNFEVICSDFTNVDDMDQRIVVMTRREDNDRSEDRFLLQFNKHGQAKLLSTIPKQKYSKVLRIKENRFPLTKFRCDYFTGKYEFCLL